MRFGVLHRITTDAVGALAVLALLAATSGDAPMTVAMGMTLLSALALPPRVREARSVRRAIALALAIAIGFTLVRVHRGHSIVTASFEVLTLILLARIASRRGAEDDTSLVVLSLCGFLAASLVAPLTYAVSFVGMVVVTPAALTLSHLRREVEGNRRQGARDRAGMPVDVARILRSQRVVGRGFLVAALGLALLVFAVVGAFFAIVPRPVARATIGLSDSIDLGNGRPLATDETTVLRFRVADVDAAAETAPDHWPLRLRGAALVDFDGRRWRHDDRAIETRIARLRQGHGDSTRARRFSIDLDAMEPPLLLVPTGTIAVATDDELLEYGTYGELRTRGIHAVHYDVWTTNGEPTAESLGSIERARALALPADFPLRVRSLAHAWSDPHASSSAKAQAIERALREGYRYELDSSARGMPSPVEHFLFEARAGHCELFASAMAAMLREVEIPSRVVTGFAGGRRNRFGGFYGVKQRDAHAWVEAYVDGAWRTYDPTPSAAPPPIERGALATMNDAVDTLGFGFRQHIVGYDSTFAREHARQVIAALLALVVAIFVFARIDAMRRRRRLLSGRAPSESDELGASSSGESALLYRRLEDVLAARGIVRPISTTPSQLAASLEAANHPAAAEVRRLTEIYLASRFGDLMLSPEQRAAFVRCTDALRAT